MKIEATVTAFGAAASFAASTTAGAGGAVLVFGETWEGLALILIAAFCSVVSSMYYRTHANESAVRDIVVTVLMPFIAGAILAHPLSEFLAFQAKSKFNVILAPFASHGLSGCVTGFALTPIARFAFEKLGKIGAAIEAAEKAAKGGKP